MNSKSIPMRFTPGRLWRLKRIPLRLQAGGAVVAAVAPAADAARRRAVDVEAVAVRVTLRFSVLVKWAQPLSAA
jgi:hypothetical protein